MSIKNQPSDQEQLLKAITTLLQKARIPYMITGALSVIFYGRPRASHDIDFIIEAEEKNVGSLIKTFLSLPHKEFIIDPTLIKDAVIHKNMFNLLHLPTMLKLDFFLLKNEEFDKSRFQRKKTLNIFGKSMTFASPEDTILIKLLWYKDTKIEKHLVDAAFVYQIQEKNLDKSYLNSWAKKQKTTKFLKKLREFDLRLYY